MEGLIKSNDCDFVAMCCPFIREQDLVSKIMAKKRIKPPAFPATNIESEGG
jgi:2,4-dienoyl-CoA reductase-like NADH-dependent reductase (Old Yellow Enzyme family)